ATTICAGETSNAVTIAEGAGDYDTYEWSPNTGVSGDETTGWTFNPDETTVYTLTVSQSAGVCVASVEYTVTVNSLIDVDDIEGEVCVGQVLELNSGISSDSPIVIGAGALTSVASTTGATLGPNPLQVYYGNTKQQWVYTADELTSNGFLAGTSINSFAIELAAAGNNAINNLVVKMKNSSITAFATTSSWESGMTVVKAASSHTAVVGANTFVLDTPFVWDGSSSLVIEVNYR